MLEISVDQPEFQQDQYRYHNAHSENTSEDVGLGISIDFTVSVENGGNGDKEADGLKAIHV